jgi:hypothetical protein
MTRLIAFTLFTESRGLDPDMSREFSAAQRILGKQDLFTGTAELSLFSLQWFRACLI